VVELEQSVINLSRECQSIREKMLLSEFENKGHVKTLWSFISALQTTVQQMGCKMEIAQLEMQRTVLRVQLKYDKLKQQLKSERKHNSTLLFIIQSQRGSIRFCTDVMEKMGVESRAYETEQVAQKSDLRRQVWEQVFAFTRLSTDVDALFEFFAARLANLAGARANLNNQLASNGAGMYHNNRHNYTMYIAYTHIHTYTHTTYNAYYYDTALVLGALCKSPKPTIRKLAARALGGMGWDGFVETRILMWDRYVSQ
jgi:hypothetical protein